MCVKDLLCNVVVTNHSDHKCAVRFRAPGVDCDRSYHSYVDSLNCSSSGFTHSPCVLTSKHLVKCHKNMSSCQFKRRAVGLERRLRGEERWFLQRTWASTELLITTCNSGRRGSDSLFWPLPASGIRADKTPKNKTKQSRMKTSNVLKSDNLILKLIFKKGKSTYFPPNKIQSWDTYSSDTVVTLGHK